MKNKQLWKNYLLLAVGLSILALGVAFSIKGALGTSPISSLPYVLSLMIPSLTVGNLTIMMHIVMILLQILLLRKDFEWMQLMQLPVAFFFGYLTDFWVWVTNGIAVSSYFGQWTACGIGILLVGIGVSFEVKAGVVVLAGEGLILALCKVLDVEFPKMKIINDVTLVSIAAVLSLIFLKGLYGVREGTIAAAVLVGAVAKQSRRIIDNFVKI
ncbi:MAG: YitT family protein [Firmicutes bacterium]|nr:YitT family protein [Bacillota bacterium]